MTRIPSNMIMYLNKNNIMMIMMMMMMITISAKGIFSLATVKQQDSN